MGHLLPKNTDFPPLLLHFSLPCQAKTWPDRLHALGIETFCCATHSPWQQGGVENALGRVRRTRPRQTDWAAVPEERVPQLLQASTTTPRQGLAYRTPAEIFLNRALHLQGESTCPPAREYRAYRNSQYGCVFDAIATLLSPLAEKLSCTRGCRERYERERDRSYASL